MSLMIYVNGEIELLIENTNEIEINIEDIYKAIEQCNYFIKTYVNKPSIYINKNKKIDKIEFLFDRNFLSNTTISLFDCEILFTNDKFKNKKGQFIYDKEALINLFSNLYNYTRVIYEKNIDVKENYIYLRYKKIDNYDNIDTKISLISTLKNPNLNFSDDKIIEIISESFSISTDDASKELDNWMNSVQGKIVEGKNVYTTSVSEPGTEIVIKKTSNFISIGIGGVKSIGEYNRVVLFIKTVMKLYSEYIQNINIGKTHKLYFMKTIKKDIDINEGIEKKNITETTMNDLAMEMQDDINEEENIDLLMGLDDIEIYKTMKDEKLPESEVLDIPEKVQDPHYEESIDLEELSSMILLI